MALPYRICPRFRQKTHNFSGVGLVLGLIYAMDLDLVLEYLAPSVEHFFFGDGTLKTTIFLSDTLDNDDDQLALNLRL